MCCEIGGSVKSVQGLNNDISECPSKPYNPKPQAVGTAAPSTFIHVQHTICKRQPIRKKWEANLKLMIPDCVWTEGPDSCAHFSSQRDLCHHLLLLGKCINCSPLRSWINSQEHQWSILFKAHCNHAEETSIIGKTLQVHLNLRKLWF